MYPSLMIEYDFLSRNVENPEKYEEIRDTRLEWKKNKDPRQLPLKIVLNGTYGAMKDKYNNLFDPRMANNVCIAGQLLLLDLIEKVEPYCDLIQSNTDGILVRLHENQRENYLRICTEWSNRVRLDLEHDDYIKVIQKDVNNYIIVDKNGNYKSKGAYVKKLNNIDYDLPIVNKALINYFTQNTPVSDTINRCKKLKEFQKIVKISKLYEYGFHGEVLEENIYENDKKIDTIKKLGNGTKFKEKVLRVFASNELNNGGIFKIKLVNNKEKIEKVGNTPENAFIYNDNINEIEVLDKLDRDYYIKLAEKRIYDFLNKEQSSSIMPSDISGINIEVKNIVVKSIDCNNTFIDLLVCLDKEKQVNKTHIQKMIELSYFDKFGGIKKLLKLQKLFKTWSTKKTAKIKNPPFDEKLISKYSQKKTDKQYSGVNYVEIISELEKTLPDEDFSIQEKIDCQIEYLGYVNLLDGTDKRRCVIVGKKENEYNTKLDLYSLVTGSIIQFKITKGNIKDEFKIGNILRIKNFEKSYKKIPRKDENGEVIRKPDGKPKHFDKTDELEWVLKSYIIEN